MTLTTADLDRAHADGMDEIDPSGRPRRRTFTAADKRAYLDEYDALPKGSPERGAFLRREGLYSSHMSEWRKQRDSGALAGLAAKPRTDRRPASDVELDRSRRQAPGSRPNSTGRGWRWKSWERRTRSWIMPTSGLCRL